MTRAAHLRLLLGLVVVSVLLTPFRRELFAGDETKYAQVIREMRNGGHVFLPTLEGSPFTHKPPLHFWIVYALTYVFGAYTVWPYVIPSIVAFGLLLVILSRMGGPLAAFVCATAVMIWGSAQSARMDLTFTALIALAAMYMMRFFDNDDFRALLVAAVLLGVAVVVKGPMSLVIGIALFVFEWIRRRRVPRGNYLPAALALIVVPLLWLVPAILVGGQEYTNELLYKQTLRRAVGSWVHRSPPWFYITHAPGTLFPWFFLVVIAIFAAYRRGDDRAKFFVSWILAVLVPYSLLSSKLDVYMMAMIPPVSILIARLFETSDVWIRRAHWTNAAVIALLLLIGVLGLVFFPRVPLPYQRADVRMLLVVLSVAALVALTLALVKRDAIVSTLLVGIVPLCALVYVAIFLTPIANEEASARPLVHALARLDVPAESMALYTTPHLWSRDMPRSLERVRYVNPDALRHGEKPEVIATSRRYAKEIAFALEGYRRIGEVRMIGKWFDVYRR